MLDEAQSLPDDIAALKAMIVDSAKIGVRQCSSVGVDQEIDLVSFSRRQIDGKPVVVALILDMSGGDAAHLDRASRAEKILREIVLNFPHPHGVCTGCEVTEVTYLLFGAKV